MAVTKGNGSATSWRDRPDARKFTPVFLRPGTSWRPNSNPNVRMSMASEFPGEKSRVRSVASGCPASKGNSSSAGLLVNFNHKKGLGPCKHKIAQAEWKCLAGRILRLLTLEVVDTIKWMVINWVGWQIVSSSGSVREFVDMCNKFFVLTLIEVIQIQLNEYRFAAAPVSDFYVSVLGSRCYRVKLWFLLGKLITISLFSAP